MSILQVKASLEFLRKGVIAKIQKGKVIIAGIIHMASSLPNLPVLPADLTVLNDDLEAKAKTAASGDHSAVSAKNTSEKKWIAAFKDTANYVTQASGGQKDFIQACGLDATSEESVPRSDTEALVNLVGKVNPTPGSIELESDGQKQADGYVYTLVPPGTDVKQNGNMIIITIGENKIYIIPDTHHKVAQTGFTSKQSLDIYGAAFNLNGTGPLTKAGNEVTPQ